jgi:hypothetical protein
MPLLHDLAIVLLHNSNPVSEFTEDILQGCPPSLTSLELDSCILMSCTFDTIGPIYRQNSIQRLVLSNVVFHKGADSTLSRYVVNT